MYTVQFNLSGERDVQVADSVDDLIGLIGDFVGEHECDCIADGELTLPRRYSLHGDSIVITAA